jgi:quinol monooxygenase YgiN
MTTRLAAKLGFLVRLEVKPDKVAEYEARLRASLPAIEDEPGTTAWFAVRLGPTSYGVFDVFPDEAARQAHMEAGRIRLGGLADLLAEPPSIVRTEVIVAKLP